MEVMVSMVILAIVSLGVAATIVYVRGNSARQPGVGNLDLIAVNFARQTLDQLKNAVSTRTAAGQNGAPLLSTGGGCTANDLPAGTPLAGFAGQRMYRVTDVDADIDGSTDYKLVTVRVSWTDPGQAAPNPCPP